MYKKEEFFLKDIIDIGKNFGLESKQVLDVLMFVFSLNKKDLLFLDKIDTKKIDEIISIFGQLQKGYPFAYIEGKKEFYGRDFIVSSDVLIPRDDTGVIIDGIKKYFPLFGKFLNIDVGTGSGIIPITLLCEKLCFYSILVDISQKALNIAKKNIKKYDLGKNTFILNSDLLKNIEIQKIIKNLSYIEKYDTIVLTANLPYIKENDLIYLDENVSLYEPSLALFGGKGTGFELYEKLFFQIKEYQKEFKNIKIYCFFEIGVDQFEYSYNFLTKQKVEFEYLKDTANINRTIFIKNLICD